MDHEKERTNPTEQELRKVGWRRNVWRGLVAAALVTVGCALPAVPAVSPPTVVIPAKPGIHPFVTSMARRAYVRALLDNGYELLPPIDLEGL